MFITITDAGKGKPYILTKPINRLKMGIKKY